MSNGFEDAATVEPVRIRGLSGEAVGGNFYEKVGGKETFKKIADKFYEGVAADEILRPMYPEQDLGPAAERLQLFLSYHHVQGTPLVRRDEHSVDGCPYPEREDQRPE